jgi:hypothetical protein
MALLSAKTWVDGKKKKVTSNKCSPESVRFSAANKAQRTTPILPESYSDNLPPAVPHIESGLPKPANTIKHAWLLPQLFRWVWRGYLKSRKKIATGDINTRPIVGTSTARQ